MIKNREDSGIKHLNHSNAFTECSYTMDDVYENINEYNPSRGKKMLIVFDDMIVDILTNENISSSCRRIVY